MNNPAKQRGKRRQVEKGLQVENVLARGARCFCHVHSAAVSPTVGLYWSVWDAPLSWGTGYLESSRSRRSEGPSGHAGRSYFGAWEADELAQAWGALAEVMPPKWPWSHLPRQCPVPPLALPSPHLIFSSSAPSVSYEDEISGGESISKMVNFTYM